MRRSTLAAVFLLAGCGAGPDPASAPRALPPTALEPPPVYSLLGFRQEIGLTSEQVTALDSIAEAVRQENAPLVQVLRERNPVRAQQRGLIVVDPVSEPALVQLRENNRRAATAVGEVLTPEQRTVACRVLDQSQRDRMARRGSSQQSARARQGRGPRGLEPADTLWARGSGGWPWCTPGSPAPATQPTPPVQTPHVETPPDTLTDG